ncbi:MAG: DUF4126 domain-containing protein [Acidobacteria bacterium]|nr:DUF4126 domain-containing protein [Acidobacteriota bacterium]
MDLAQVLSSLLGIGLASGLNVYAVVLTLGAAQRLGWLSNLPAGMDVFAHPIVLGVAAVMYAAEFVADKVPGFTPIWDGIHTFIRPVGAAVVAFSAFGNLDPVMRAVAMIVAGSLAMGSHATKMGTRLAAHTVPDPVTHSAISVAEDFSVVGILLLAYNYPWVALPLLLGMVVAIGVALPFLFRVVGFLLRTLQGRLLSFVKPEAQGGAGETMVVGYVRTGKGLGRLRKASWRLKPGQASVVIRGWFGRKELEVSPPLRHAEGLFLDYVELNTREGQPLSLYLTKDWAAVYREAI